MNRVPRDVRAAVREHVVGCGTGRDCYAAAALVGEKGSVTGVDMTPEQRVHVVNKTGEMRGLVLRSFPEIKSGNILMYYPEANVLVPRVTDPKSRTPAFKGVLVSVKAAEA